MNAMNPYLQQYKKNQIETATPEEILILLYDAAINNLNKAKVALENNDNDLFRYNMLNCKNIILEFMNSLDMEAGGKFAETLYNLYRYYHKILVKSEVTQDTQGIDEVLRHLTSLRETWQKAIEIAKAEKGSILVDKYEPAQDGNDEEYDYEDSSDEAEE